jgi:Helix-turn-helix of DDE superfamily endonuclease
MYHTTGLTRGHIVDLCVFVNSAEQEPGAPRWPPVLGLFKSVVVTLTYMRHNRIQAEIGDSFDVSQPTITRAITPLPAEQLLDYAPTADELDAGTQYIVEGTRLPCWSCISRPGLCSGSTRPPE